MSQFPWHNQFPLTLDDVAGALRADIPELAGAPLVPLGEGWDFVAFLADGRWVLRFPKRRSSVRRLHHEMTLLGDVHRATAASTVRVPIYRWYVEVPRTLPLSYAGYGYLTGDPVIDVAPDRGRVTNVAAPLGAFLRALHALPLARKRRYRDQFAGHVPEFRQHLHALGAVIPPALLNALLGLLASRLPPYAGEPRFCHADLLMEHVLVDGDEVAVIDWGDASWDDPWSDFVGLWTWGGDAAVETAVQHYGTAPTSEDWHRIRYKGACVCIGQAYFGHFDRRPSLLRASLEALQRMHEAGQIDDPHRRGRFN